MLTSYGIKNKGTVVTVLLAVISQVVIWFDVWKFYEKSKFMQKSVLHGSSGGYWQCEWI
jgi:hypothetical protein